MRTGEEGHVLDHAEDLGKGRLMVKVGDGRGGEVEGKWRNGRERELGERGKRRGDIPARQLCGTW